MEKPHNGCGEQRQRGIGSKGGPDIAAGHHREEEGRVGDVEGGAGQCSLDFRTQDLQPGGKVTDGNGFPHGRLPFA